MNNCFGNQPILKVIQDSTLIFLLTGSLSGKPMFSLCKKWRKFAGYCKVTLMQLWTISYLAPDSDNAELLPVLSNKLPFFSIEALAQIAQQDSHMMRA